MCLSVDGLLLRHARMNGLERSCHVELFSINEFASEHQPKRKRHLPKSRKVLNMLLLFCGKTNDVVKNMIFIGIGTSSKYIESIHLYITNSPTNLSNFEKMSLLEPVDEWHILGCRLKL